MGNGLDSPKSKERRDSKLDVKLNFLLNYAKCKKAIKVLASA